MNQRRKILRALSLGTVLASLRGITQATDRVYRVACLVTNSQARAHGLVDTLKNSLRELGYVEGQNIFFSVGSHEGDLNRLPEIAAKIVADRPDVIVGGTGAVILALLRASRTIPIVMVDVTDPVGAGFAASLPHPGGNITGVSTLGLELIAKKVELIRLIAPRTTRIGIVTGPGLSSAGIVEMVRASASALGLAVQAEQIKTPEDLARVFSSFARQRASFVIVDGGPPLNGLRTKIAELSIRYKIATFSSTRAYVEAGGLLSYGQNSTQQYELAAAYVDKILKGAKLRDLPIQQPTKFELIINRKTANALGIMLSQELLLRADEVIQ